MGDIVADVYVLDANEPGGRDAERAAINGYEVSTASAEAIDSSIAAIMPNKLTVFDSEPPGSYDVEVALDLSQSRLIDQLFFGHNYLTFSYRDNGTQNTINLNDPRWATLLSYMPSGLIRYGWHNDIMWDPTNTEIPWNPDPPEYDHAIRPDHLLAIYNNFTAGNSKLYVGVNMSQDDWSDWADFTKHCVDSAIDVDYICGGNEPWGAGISAADYVARLKGYMDDMRVEKATLGFGAAEFTGFTWRNRESYVNDILGDLRDDGYPLQFMSAHHHQLKGSSSSGPSDPGHPTVANLLQWGEGIHGLEWWGTYATEICARRDIYHPGAKAIIGEYGASHNLGSWNSEEARKLWKSLGTALWMATVLGLLARNGIDGALYWTLTQADDQPDGERTWMIFDNEWTYPLRPSFYTYLLFGQWWPRGGEGYWVTSLSSSDEAKLSVNAAIDDDGNICVMLINKTENEALTVKVEIVGSPAYYFTYSTGAHTVTLVRFNSEEVLVAGGAMIRAALDLRREVGELWEEVRRLRRRMDTTWERTKEDLAGKIKQLIEAESTTDEDTTSQTWVNTALSQEITVEHTSCDIVIWVDFSCYLNNASSGSRGGVARINESTLGAKNLGQVLTTQNSDFLGGQLGVCVRYANVPAGTYTFYLQWRVTGTNTTLSCNATTSPELYVKRMLITEWR